MTNERIIFKHVDDKVAALLRLLTPENQVQSAVHEVALEYVSLSSFGYGLFHDAVSIWTIPRRMVRMMSKEVGRNRERTIVRFAWDWGI
jgi:hypothetical protein